MMAEQICGRDFFVVKKVYVQTAGSNDGLLKKMAMIMNGKKYMTSVKKSIYLKFASMITIPIRATAGGIRCLLEMNVASALVRVGSNRAGFDLA